MPKLNTHVASVVDIEISNVEPSCVASNESKRHTKRFKPEVKKAAFPDPVHGKLGADTIDESFGGIGLLFGRRPALDVGAEIQVAYNGVDMWAIVRHVTEQDDQKHLVGLEWKGACVAQKAREASGRRALRVRQRTQKGSDDDQKRVRTFDNFVRMIPGGVYMMWSLFEADNMSELGEAAGRLVRQSVPLDIKSIVAANKRLQEAIGEDRDRGEIRDALESLINECIDACERVS